MSEKPRSLWDIRQEKARLKEELNNKRLKREALEAKGRMAKLDDFDDDPDLIPKLNTAPKLSEPKAYVPDYRPVIKALRELTRAFEVIDNRGIPPPLLVPEEEHKRRSDSAKKRWEGVPPEKRRAITAAARAARH